MHFFERNLIDVQYVSLGDRIQLASRKHSNAIAMPRQEIRISVIMAKTPVVPPWQ
jgi:hypothetical protein